MGQPVIGPGAWETTLAQLDGAVAADETLIAAPGAGKCIYLERVAVTIDAAGVIKVTEGNDSATTRIHNGYHGANQGVLMDFGDRPKKLPENTALKITTTGATNKKAVAHYVVGDI